MKCFKAMKLTFFNENQIFNFEYVSQLKKGNKYPLQEDKSSYLSAHITTKQIKFNRSKQLRILHKSNKILSPVCIFS